MRPVVKLTAARAGPERHILLRPRLRDLRLGWARRARYPSDSCLAAERIQSWLDARRNLSPPEHIAEVTRDTHRSNQDDSIFCAAQLLHKRAQRFEPLLDGEGELDFRTPGIDLESAPWDAASVHLEDPDMLPIMDPLETNRSQLGYSAQERPFNVLDNPLRERLWCDASLHERLAGSSDALDGAPTFG